MINPGDLLEIELNGQKMIVQVNIIDTFTKCLRGFWLNTNDEHTKRITIKLNQLSSSNVKILNKWDKRD